MPPVSNNAEAAVLDAQQNYADLINQTTVKQTELDATAGAVNSLKLQQQEFDIQLISIKNQIKDAQSQMKTINEAINNSQAALDKNVADSLAAQNKNADLTNQCDAKRKLLDSLSMAINSQQDEINNLCAAINKQNQDNQAVLAEANNKLADLKTQQQQILIANEILVSQNKTINDEIISNSNVLDLLIKNVTDHNTEIDALNQQINDAKNTLTMITGQIDGANNSLGNVKQQIKSTNNDLDAANKQVSDAKTQYDLLLSKANNLSIKSDYLTAMEADIKQKYEKIGEQYQPFQG